jgi:hypothetical protein
MMRAKAESEGDANQMGAGEEGQLAAMFGVLLSMIRRGVTERDQLGEH